jgi:hypothetical protein
MKKLLIIIIIIVFGFRSNAQDPQLFDNTWYLEKVILDNVEYLRPFEDFEALLYLTLEDFEVFHPSCQEGFGSPIQYSMTDSTFSIDDGGVSIIGICVVPEVLIFVNKHYSVYLIDNNFARNPFTYVLETVNDHTSLTIINADGDQAIYGDALLGVDEFSEEAISVYPNPVNDILTIDNTTTTEITSIKLYDVLGRLVMVVESDYNQVGVSSLNSGVFFLNIETDRGLITKKIIKE